MIVKSGPSFTPAPSFGWVSLPPDNSKPRYLNTELSSMRIAKRLCCSRPRHRCALNSGGHSARDHRRADMYPIDYGDDKPVDRGLAKIR
jgi:hypothetical protein